MSPHNLFDFAHLSNFQVTFVTKNSKKLLVYYDCDDSAGELFDFWYADTSTIRGEYGNLGTK